MQNIWFTSDHHFGHTKILEYEAEARPFKHVDEMNEALIDRWNSVVRDNDIVYHLGDFCFGKHNMHIADRLEGTKRLVLGNHDSYGGALYLRYFEKIYGVKYLDEIIMSHVPIYPTQFRRRWVNVHGHLHSRKVRKEFTFDPECCSEIEGKEHRHYFNVSVEQNNLVPFHYDEIKKRVREMKDAAR